MLIDFDFQEEKSNKDEKMRRYDKSYAGCRCAGIWDVTISTVRYNNVFCRRATIRRQPHKHRRPN